MASIVPPWCFLFVGRLGGLSGLASPLSLHAPHRFRALFRAVFGGTVEFAGCFLCCFLVPSDAHWPSVYASALKESQDLVRHPIREVDRTVFLKDIDSTYIVATDICFVGNGADNVSGFDTVDFTYLNAIAIHAFVWW